MRDRWFTGLMRGLPYSDPDQALKDVRAAHAWATIELKAATEPIRIFNLTQERKRLAGIFAELKRVAA